MYSYSLFKVPAWFLFMTPGNQNQCICHHVGANSFWHQYVIPLFCIKFEIFGVLSGHGVARNFIEL